MARPTVLALDLERTLVYDASTGYPRPGLYDFLAFCVERFPRVVLYTAVSRGRAEPLITQLSAEGFVPTAFASKLEYVEWDADYKDLNYVGGAAPAEILLVDDDPAWIRPGQEAQHLLVAPFDPLRNDGQDAELRRIRLELEKRLGQQPGWSEPSPHRKERLP